MNHFATFFRRRGWLIPIVTIGAALILWFNGRGRPERLGDKDPLASNRPPLEMRYSLRERARDHKLLLIYQGYAGNTDRTISSVPLPSGFHYGTGVGGAQINGQRQVARDDGIYFALDSPPPPRPVRKLAQRAGQASGGSGLSFGRPYHSPAKPIVHRWLSLPSDVEIRLCRLSLTGGPLDTIRSGKGISSIGLTDDTAYWIDPRPEPRIDIEDKTGSHTIITPTSLLMATSLQTRRTRRIAGRVPSSLQFSPDHTALYWKYIEDAIGNPLRTQLWRYAPDLPQPVRLSDSYNRSELPVAVGDRLYWLEDHQAETSIANPAAGSPSSPLTQTVQTDVVSAKRDGTQRRLVLSLPVKEGLPALDTLQADRGRLYACLKEREAAPNRAGSVSTICRIDPDASQPLVKLFRLPLAASVYRFQDSYAYYSVSEERDSLFGNAPVTSAVSYYRWKLPE